MLKMNKSGLLHGSCFHFDVASKTAVSVTWFEFIILNFEWNGKECFRIMIQIRRNFSPGKNPMFEVMFELAEDEKCYPMKTNHIIESTKQK